MFILYVESFIIYNNFVVVESLGFSMCTIIPSANGDNFIHFFSLWMTFISFLSNFSSWDFLYYVGKKQQG